MSSKWYAIKCEVCGAEISVHEDWVNIPKACKKCRDEKKNKINPINKRNISSDITEER